MVAGHTCNTFFGHFFGGETVEATADTSAPRSDGEASCHTHSRQSSAGRNWRCCMQEGWHHRGVWGGAGRRARAQSDSIVSDDRGQTTPCADRADGQPAPMDAVLLKAVAHGREVERRREAERKRALLVLILRHLLDHGYADSVECLTRESSVALSSFDAADNIALLQVLQDWEDGHEQRYSRRPRLIKAVQGQQGGHSRQVSRQTSSTHACSSAVLASLCPSAAAPVSGQMAAKLRRDKAAAAAGDATPGQAHNNNSSSSSSSRTPSFKGTLPSSRQQQLAAEPAADGARSSCTSAGSRSDGSLAAGLEVSGRGCEVAARGSGPAAGDCEDGEELRGDLFSTRLLRPLPTGLLGELKELGASISRDIFLESPNVQFTQIAGLHEAKQLLQESVVLPCRHPQLFTGLLAPWRGVLLYGPPGTGKTMLAKAVATSCHTTFFNISASTIVSKWRGDSEKLVKVLFDLARHHAPSTIFLDEVDSLMGARGAEGEHEASRRMKSELLIQMDGLTQQASGSAGGDPLQVFVLAASNLPGDLDHALLRRLPKRILVPLPDVRARLSMLTALLGPRVEAGAASSLQALAAATEGFSGADITSLAKEAAMRPLRRLLAVLEPAVYAGSSSSSCQGSAAAAAPTSSKDGPTGSLGPVTAEDLSAALAATKPSAQGMEQHYAEFSSRFGQVL